MSAPLEQAMDVHTGGEAIAELFERAEAAGAGEPPQEIVEPPAPEAEVATEPQPTEPAGDPEKEPTDSEETSEPDAEADAPIETVEHLAEAMGASPEEVLSSIKVKVKLDGEEREVTLAEQNAGYLRQEDYTHKTMRLAEDRRQFETERDQSYATHQQKAQEVLELYARAHKMVEAEMNSETMAELEELDEGRWAYLREKQRQKMQRIEQETAQVMAQHQQLTQHRTQQRMQREFSRIQGEVPNWGTEHVGRVQSTMRAYGFTDQEAASVVDGRFVLAMHELGQLREENAKLRTASDKDKVKQEAVKKQVRRLPRLVKPGTSQKARGAKTQAEHFKRRVAKTGDVDDAAAAIEALLKGT